MGAVDLRLVYGNSHPPLYNWLVRGALEATGWNWALSVALVRAALLAATYLLVFDAARRLAGVEGGVLAVAAAALLPQVSWMAAHTLAHSILVMAAAAGVVHALVILADAASAPPSSGRHRAGRRHESQPPFFSSARRVAVRAGPPPCAPALRYRRALLAAASRRRLRGGRPGGFIRPRSPRGRLEKLYVDGPFSAIEFRDRPGPGSSPSPRRLWRGRRVLGRGPFGPPARPPRERGRGTVRRRLSRTGRDRLFPLSPPGSSRPTTLARCRERYSRPLLMPLCQSLAALQVLAAMGEETPHRFRRLVARRGLSGQDRRGRDYGLDFAPLRPAPGGRIGRGTPWRRRGRSSSTAPQVARANVPSAMSMAGARGPLLGDPLAEPAAILVECMPAAASIDASRHDRQVLLRGDTRSRRPKPPAGDAGDDHRSGSGGPCRQGRQALSDTRRRNPGWPGGSGRRGSDGVIGSAPARMAIRRVAAGEHRAAFGDLEGRRDASPASRQPPEASRPPESHPAAAYAAARGPALAGSPSAAAGSSRSP